MSNYADLNERAILALYARLKNNLNANIDLVNLTTQGDSSRNPTLIKYPAQVLDAPPVAGQLVSFPIVAIADGPMTFVDDVGWGATGQYDLMAMVYESDPDPVTLAWKLRRQLQALVTTVTKGRNMDEGTTLGAWGLIVKRIVPGNRQMRPSPNGPTEMMQWAAVQITLKDEQNYP